MRDADDEQLQALLEERERLLKTLMDEMIALQTIGACITKHMERRRMQEINDLEKEIESIKALMDGKLEK